MARRLRIGVDVDGVLADFVSAFHDEAEVVLQRLLPQTTDSWDFSNWDLKKGDEARIWNHVKATDDWFYLHLNALPGVVKNLPWLTEEHDVFFITTRIQTAGLSIKRQTELFLSDLGVTFPTVIVTKDKGPIASALQLNVFIDDKFENVERVGECSPSTDLYLMAASYNRAYTIPKTWKVVGCFEEFINKLDGRQDESERPSGR